MKVIKLGGSLLDDKDRRHAALKKIVGAWRGGEPVVLVHGGGKNVDALMARLGMTKRTAGGLRVTDDATLEVVTAVLAGSVNKLIVSELTQLGVRACGISGADAGTITAAVHPPVGGVDLGHVGAVTGGNPAVISALLDRDILPVVSSVAIAADGALLNVNADNAAAAVAISMDATMLHFITDVPGVLDQNGAVVPWLLARDARTMLDDPEVVSGGMRPKLHAALHALDAGVALITIGEEGGTQLVAA
jgi:acetylglutamate kinase